MELKVLFLDIDNTLLDFNAAAEESMKHCFRMFETGISAGDVFRVSGRK